MIIAIVLTLPSNFAHKLAYRKHPVHQVNAQSSENIGSYGSAHGHLPRTLRYYRIYIREGGGGDYSLQQQAKSKEDWGYMAIAIIMKHYHAKPSVQYTELAH